MVLAIPVVLGAGAVGAIAGAVGAWWLYRRTRLSALNVYVFAPVGVAVFVGALATLQGTLIAATAPFAAAGVGGAAIARRLRLAALGAGGELREFEQARVMLWTTLTGGALVRRREARDRGDRTYIAGQGELVRERGWPAEDPLVILNGLNNTDKHEELNPAFIYAGVARGVDLIEVLDRSKVKVEENLWTDGMELEHGTLLARYLIDGPARHVVRADDAAHLGFATGKIGSARAGYLAMIDRVRDIAKNAERVIDSQP